MANDDNDLSLHRGATFMLKLVFPVRSAVVCIVAVPLIVNVSTSTKNLRFFIPDVSGNIPSGLLLKTS